MIFVRTKSDGSIASVKQKKIKSATTIRKKLMEIYEPVDSQTSIELNTHLIERHLNNIDNMLGWILFFFVLGFLGAIITLIA